MAWEERYGGFWHLSLRRDESVLFERYLPDLDLMALVVNRADGLLSVHVLRKEKDPQWRLPI